MSDPTRRDETRPEDEPIGTVEILRTRIYPLDPNMLGDHRATEVVVQPGVYPVYRDMDATFWMMTGRRNARTGRKLGDGLFTMGGGDGGFGPEVTFPSMSFGPEQFVEFLTEDAATEGHPDQRLRFNIAVAGGIR